MKRILPVDEKPEMREIHTSAYMLSMLNMYEHFSKKWILQNSINIVYSSMYSGVLTYKFSSVWFLKYFNAHPSIYYPGRDVIKHMKKEIESGYYLIICVNEEYIPNREAYGKHYFEHDIMIHGYDDAIESFYTIAYDIDGVYKSTPITYKLIEKAFMTHREHNFKFYSLKPNEKFPFDNIDEKAFWKSIRLFLCPKKDNEGIMAYKHFISITETKINNQKDLDLRSFRMIMERATSICLLNEYFVLENKMVRILEEHKELATITFALAIKYNITHSMKDAEKVLMSITKFVQQENEIFTSMLAGFKFNSVLKDNQMKHRLNYLTKTKLSEKIIHFTNWCVFLLLFMISELIRVYKEEKKNRSG
jgi:hypothetical protein